MLKEKVETLEKSEESIEEKVGGSTESKKGH